MRTVFLASTLFLHSCASLVTPDGVMIGQGVGDKADGTFVYVNWAIPQP
jgi:hypothetical protein